MRHGFHELTQNRTQKGLKQSAQRPARAESADCTMRQESERKNSNREMLGYPKGEATSACIDEVNLAFDIGCLAANLASDPAVG